MNDSLSLSLSLSLPLPPSLHCLQATLHSGLDLSQVVKVPDDQEYEDWIAVNVVDFFNRINIIYGTVCDICTDASCPMMSGGPKFEYYWADETQKKPQALPAPKVEGERRGREGRREGGEGEGDRERGREGERVGERESEREREKRGWEREIVYGAERREVHIKSHCCVPTDHTHFSIPCPTHSTSPS